MVALWKFICFPNRWAKTLLSLFFLSGQWHTTCNNIFLCILGGNCPWLVEQIRKAPVCKQSQKNTHKGQERKLRWKWKGSFTGWFGLSVLSNHLFLRTVYTDNLPVSLLEYCYLCNKVFGGWGGLWGFFGVCFEFFIWGSLCQYHWTLSNKKAQMQHDPYEDFGPKLSDTISFALILKVFKCRWRKEIKHEFPQQKPSAIFYQEIM